MKSSGILNTELLAALSRLGHTDTFVIADAGLPVPPGVPVVDLRVVLGVPTFDQVIAAIAAEVVAEGAVIASEAGSANPRIAPLVEAFFVEPEPVPHERFKQLTATAGFIVRTGESAPYANVIVRCGVPF